jgi:threonine synthase
MSVSEQEIADAKAIIGRDGIGCEPASATTVAGIKKLVAGKVIQPGETVVAILTGHLLKDTDYVINYHRDTLALPGDDGDSEHRISGTFANQPIRVEATRNAVMERLKHLGEN